MTAKTTSVRTLYVHVVLNGVIFRQILQDTKKLDTFYLSDFSPSIALINYASSYRKRRITHVISMSTGINWVRYLLLMTKPPRPQDMASCWADFWRRGRPSPRFAPALNLAFTCSPQKSESYRGNHSYLQLRAIRLGNLPKFFVEVLVCYLKGRPCTTPGKIQKVVKCAQTTNQ